MRESEYLLAAWLVVTAGTRVLYGTMRALGALACALPRRVTLALAAGFARLVWLLYRMTPYRDFVPTNILSARPELDGPQANALGAASLVNLTRSIAELMRFPIFAREADAIAGLEGAEHLGAALAAGKGAILVTAHFGNWELLGAVLARRFGPIAALVQTPSKDAFARLFIEYRRLIGMETYSNTGPQSLRPALRVLRDNHMLALLCDQHGAAKEAQATFFGQRVWVPLGPFTLARRTGAAILPVRMVRRPDGVHRAIVDPPLPLDDSDDVNAQRLVGRYEAWIEADPDHWLWVHNRWEFTVPEAERTPQHNKGRIPGVLPALLLGFGLLLSTRPATAQLLAKPIIVAYPDRLEVVDTQHPDTHGTVALPGPAEAALYLPGRDLLVVHMPAQSAVSVVDLAPFSPTRFEAIKTFRSPDLGAFDLGFEQAGGEVLLGYGDTVLAHFDERHWTYEIGFDRPDAIAYPFDTASTVYLPSGVFVLRDGELDFAANQRDPSGIAANGHPLALSAHPHALLADPAGDRLYVAEATALQGKPGGYLAVLDPDGRRILAEIATGPALSSLAWVDGHTLAVLGGDRIGLFDTRRQAFTRWITLDLPGGPPLRLFPAGQPG